MEETIKKIGEKKVIAVIRGDSADKVIKAVDALVEGGVSLIEITFTNQDPLRIIETCARRDDAVVGAGTVLSLKDAKDAVAAGAKFLVSPCLIPEIVTYGAENNVLVTPGVFTPTEAFQALSLGAKVLKLFPGSIGGPDHIKALRGPFPGTKIIPTGGVDKGNIKDWFAAGALAVGLGTNLVSKDAIAKEDYAVITARAREIMALVEG